MAEKDDDDRESDEPSGDVDLTGWDRTGDEAEQRKRNRRKRITLDVFAGPPLQLPTASRSDSGSASELASTTSTPFINSFRYPMSPVDAGSMQTLSLPAAASCRAPH